MNWDWACEQLLKEQKVRLHWYNDYTYLFANEDGDICIHRFDGSIVDYNLCTLDLTATDWELYQEPKKWTKTQQYYAKKLIVIGAEYIVCNKSGRIWAFDTKPIKNLKVSTNKWLAPDKYTDCVCNIIGTPLSLIFGNNVKWEDEKPTRLQDIVDSEVEE